MPVLIAIAWCLGIAELAAGFNPAMVLQGALLAGLLALTMLLVKPDNFKVDLVRAGERRRVSGEIGARRFAP
jgi:hypothetical protein